MGPRLWCGLCRFAAVVHSFVEFALSFSAASLRAPLVRATHAHRGLSVLSTHRTKGWLPAPPATGTTVEAWRGAPKDGAGVELPLLGAHTCARSVHFARRCTRPSARAPSHALARPSFSTVAFKRARLTVCRWAPFVICARVTPPPHVPLNGKMRALSVTSEISSISRGQIRAAFE